MHDYGFTGRRLYRTGDLVQQNLDSSIAYFDRRDEQIIVDGQRVIKIDIENQISLVQPHIHGYVAGIVSTPQGSKLAAAIHTRHFEVYGCDSTQIKDILPATNTLMELLDYIQTSLSNNLTTYLVPELYVPIKHLPTTISGKLDQRTILQFIESTPDDIIQQYMPGNFANNRPLIKTELQLRLLWAKILDKEVETFGVRSYFLRLGGDSVAAMRLVAGSRDIELTITVSNVIHYPVLSDVAKCVEDITHSSQQESNAIAPFALWRDRNKLSLDAALSQHISYAAV